MDENILVKKLRMKGNDIINYTYIIIDNNSKKCVIVDPAWQLGTIINFINDEKLQVEGILLTHTHYDHVNLVDYLVNIYNCYVYISKVEKEYYNYCSKNLLVLEDCEKILIGKINIEVLITPGHTKGSACYLINDKMLFTGDTLFSEGCGNSIQPGGNTLSMFMSLQRLKKIIDEECIIYPGHAFTKEPGIKFLDIKEHNIYLKIISENIFVKLNEMQVDKRINYI